MHKNACFKCIIYMKKLLPFKCKKLMPVEIAIILLVYLIKRVMHYFCAAYAFIANCKIELQKYSFSSLENHVRIID